MEIISNIDAVMMCDSYSKFELQSLFFFSKKSKWTCNYSKASTKVFSLQDIIYDKIYSFQYYDLDKTCIYIN